MTTDPSENPSDHPSGGAPPGGEPPGGDPRGGPPPRGPDGSDTPPPRKRRRLWKKIAWAITVPAVLVALVGGLLYGVVVTERGTAYVWQTAVKLLHGQLEGKLDGGAIATGLHMRDVRWRSFDGSGTDIRVDRIDGKWALSDKPWRFVVDYLHIGTVDARIAPSTSKSEPMSLPKDLRLPLQLAVRDLSVEKLILHEGASTSEYARLLFHGRSDGR
ncbi:MAG: translocation and assembly module protein TamB, partial [Paraburkholderia hospita]